MRALSQRGAGANAALSSGAKCRCVALPNVAAAAARRASSGARSLPRRRRRLDAASTDAASGVAGAPNDAPQGLTREQVERFYEDGFLVLPGFASRAETDALVARAGDLVEGFDPATRSSVFTTDEAQPHAADPYFLQSVSRVHFFLEEKALNDQGELAVPKARAVNKIGHALHDVDPTFRDFSRSPRMAAVLRSLGYARPLPVQSMYIFKPPGIGGEVVPHQDSSFLATSPRLSVVGLWLALQDADRTNGCLWALRGSHRAGLARRFAMPPNGGGPAFDAPQPAYDLDAFEPLEVPAGTLVLLHGENVHYSAENTSTVSRHSYTMHVVEGGKGLEWRRDNWAQRPAEMPWEPLYDAEAEK